MSNGLPNRRGVIVLLGFLIALGPLTLDMYLPAFPSIARDLHTTAAL
ncbi:MAG: Bcr/CflA family drug resistance efflux transporter, partial [Verrucomicrobia bacterium]|nr:Bcr/CflA family drug resistance efflux transporter [Verrucomicrobiota bacterium]